MIFAEGYQMKAAVIGADIAGLSCAYRLATSGQHVTLGGHSTYGVDPGFLVFNHRTYPALVKLFKEVGVATAATDMSFSLKMPIAASADSRMLKNRLVPISIQYLHSAAHLHFNSAGLINYHRDYWDAAEELYEKLPLLGGLMRILKRATRK
jgi:2-polyprenyl-6-methoxyphenol hydroxylase-like FAD-dependent oxidoreductase